MTALISTAIAAGLAMWISTSVYNARLKRVEQELETARRALNEKSMEAARLQLELKGVSRSATRPVEE